MKASLRLRTIANPLCLVCMQDREHPVVHLVHRPQFPSTKMIILIFFSFNKRFSYTGKKLIENCSINPVFKTGNSGPDPVFGGFVVLIP